MQEESGYPLDVLALWDFFPENKLIFADSKSQKTKVWQRVR
jgi:hypothetical protein